MCYFICIKVSESWCSFKVCFNLISCVIWYCYFGDRKYIEIIFKLFILEKIIDIFCGGFLYVLKDDVSVVLKNLKMKIIINGVIIYIKWFVWFL